MKEGHNKKYIMTAGSDDLSYGGGDTFVSKIGLAGSHAYSIIGVYEVGKIGGEYQLKNQGERIIKLRNPWGKGEWKGEWSDNDKRWNHKLKM